MVSMGTKRSQSVGSIFEEVGGCYGPRRRRRAKRNRPAADAWLWARQGPMLKESRAQTSTLSNSRVLLLGLEVRVGALIMNPNDAGYRSYPNVDGFPALLFTSQVTVAPSFEANL